MGLTTGQNAFGGKALATAGDRLLCCPARGSITVLAEPFWLHFVNLLQGAESFLRSQPVLIESRNSSHFREPEGSLTPLQVPATWPYPEPDRSSLCLHIPLLEDPS